MLWFRLSAELIAVIDLTRSLRLRQGELGSIIHVLAR